MISALVLVLGIATALAFLWFLYEITRLEGWPGRKWHHAYIGLALAIPAWLFVDSAWLAVLLFAVAFFLIHDDAAQHHIHNRLKRAGVAPHAWPVSWLHRLYESIVRSLTA